MKDDTHQSDELSSQLRVMKTNLKARYRLSDLLRAQKEETCDHLIKAWIARNGCPMTFQSDNGTAIIGELTKELLRRSQVAQAHSMAYYPQTNGLVER